MKFTALVISFLISAFMLSGHNLRAQVIDEQADKADSLFFYAYGLYSRNFHDLAFVELQRFSKLYPEDERMENVSIYKILCLQKMGKIDEMIEEVVIFRKRYPKSPNADKFGILVAESLFKNKKYQDAADTFESLLGSKNPVIQEYSMYYMAQCFTLLNKKNEAVNLYKTLSEKPFQEGFECRPYAAREYADALYANKNYKEALNLYTRLANEKSSPEEIKGNALYRIGEINLLLNDKAKALDAFQAYIGAFPEGKLAKNARRYRISIISDSNDYQKTIELAQEWRQRYPDVDDYDIDFSQANALLNLKHFNEAIPFFQRVEGDTNVPDRMRQDSCYASVYCHFMAAQFTASDIKAEDFLNRFPKSSLVGEVLLLQGQSLVQLKNYGKAHSSYKKALAFYAESAAKLADITEQIVNLFAIQKKWVEAADALRAMANNPSVSNHSRYLIRAAEYELKVPGRISQARIDLTKAAANTESKDDSRMAQQILMRIYLSEKDYKRALNCVEELAKNCPSEELDDILYNRAAILFYLDDYPKAEHAILEALSHKNIQADKNARALFMLARIYFAGDKYKEAVPVMDKIALLPDNLIMQFYDVEFLNNAAEAYIKNYDTKKAESMWRKILKIKNASPDETAQAKVNIAKVSMDNHGNIKQAAALLAEVAEQLNNEQDSFLNKKDVYSLLAEAQLAMGDADRAVISAEKALKFTDGEPRAQARTLYVMAYIRLKIEKRPDLANRFATQCYILLDDKVYSPKAMVLSMEAFMASGKSDKAREVFNELKAKYPQWLDEHPDVKKTIGGEVKEP